MQLLDPVIFDSMVQIRRDLHQNPELSWHEERTADRVCAFLDELGISYRRGTSDAGIVAEIAGSQEFPAVALRADLDALPIHEETGLDFSSQVEGVMHACGHDGHTSMLLGAAALLAQEKDLPVPVRLIFQPAEETGDGALVMISQGVLENVGYIFGGHLDRHYPAGSVVVTEGAVNASSDHFRIDIRGSGGHAARPHESIDAVVVGSLLVTALQTIVSREVNPAHPSVISVGRFDAGTASNVIADRAWLEGSIRAQDPEVRAHLHRSIHRISSAIGQLHGARIQASICQGTPPLINPPGPTAIAREAALDSVSKENVLKMTVANMGGEDFSYYVQQVPGCYVRFGSQIPGRENFPAHSSRFDFDERAMAVGAMYYARLAKIAGQRIVAEKER